MNTLDQRLDRLAHRIPGATEVFFDHRLDFCNSGEQTLREAAARKALDPAAIAAELEALARETETESWDQAPDSALVEHILTRYHQRHRKQLPALINLAAQVESTHRDHPDCPAGLAEHLRQMLAELESHMQKEERILFPMILRGMTEMARAPASVMRHEHLDHGRALERLDRLTHYFSPPAEACEHWRALYREAATLARDLAEHIHLENNLLFKRIEERGGL
ncbi:iron-sulfur cluster repair protein YtfE [Microbulbifer thermotolerans]|uniref:Iron-sulfur cluster repair di-iron protein n=1 Tax=Microbulbifer thermotolerans TaxID=252514 RepID=A0A143HKD3_MICTH|nr:iron-sulfur cluster repair protein YtfE [Microbulbifer thermotolerans]AMX01961.1 iron-sulfur cluster repair di-iron protein [Microbulbifer thermotolerans]MCX2794216.1 iron-sulfur cluster repair protein YtfE [Microbulbifer thermotolerans]SFB67851.1 regulator of cell morphogenesis and NO signaling [Microbulbifer thermotolerans]